MEPDKERETAAGGDEREPSAGARDRGPDAGTDRTDGRTAGAEEAAEKVAGPDAAEPAGSSEGAVAGEGEDSPELVQKRMKRARRKELLDLVQRKNEMLAELHKELVKTNQDLANKEDRLLRLAAEFENYRKRTRREWELLQKNANADLIKEIIWGIDNFDRAFANLGGAEDHIQEGIRLIHTGLMDILKKAGLSEIDALNKKFDAAYHEAVGEIESDLEEGLVAEVIQRGYMLHDQVLRPARVLVSKKKQ